MIKQKKEYVSNLHCVQCHREFVYKVDIGESLVSICHYPDCPNYALLAMPEEQMPKEKTKKQYVFDDDPMGPSITEKGAFNLKKTLVESVYKTKNKK